MAVVCLTAATHPTDLPARLATHLHPHDVAVGLGTDRVAVVLADLARLEYAHYAVMRATDAWVQLTAPENASAGIRSAAGVALFPEDGIDAAVLLACAETAASRARENGEALQYHSPELAGKFRNWFHQRLGLRLALEHDDLELRYRPVVEPESGVIVGAEAIVHGRHPLAPADHHGAEEDSPLAAQLDEWAIGALCAQADAWRAGDLGALCLALRLATGTLRQPGFARAMLAVLGECGLSPARLTTAIASGALEPGQPMVSANLQQLAQAGARLCLIDVGASPVRLQDLQRARLRGLRIAPSVVREISRTPGSGKGVAELIVVARSLALRVGADGVETRGQLEFLRERGVDTLQGPLLGPALGLEDFRRFVTVTRVDHGPARETGSDNPPDTGEGSCHAC